MSSNGIIHKRSAGNRVDIMNANDHLHYNNNGTVPLGPHTRRKWNKKDQNRILERSKRIIYVVVGMLLILSSLLLLQNKLPWKLVSLRHSQPKAENIHLSVEEIDKVWEEGDKSDEYKLLRETYDALLPANDFHRMKSFVQSLKKNVYTTARPQDMPYDIYNCPEDPPEGYPYAWNVLTVLDHWEIDDPTPRPEIYQGLCVFDYQRDFTKAARYRNFELPFIMQNDPRVLRTVERWNQPNYLQLLLGEKDYMAEYSRNNHFMYWNQPNEKRVKRLGEKLQQEIEHWKPPTERIRMTYADWLQHANTSTIVGPGMEHWYFRLIGCGKGLGPNCEKNPAEFLFDELDFFRVDHDETARESQQSTSLYIVNPSGQQGIHCRFGMRGVIAENHWDSSRNFIVVLGGERRYLLSHPNQCRYLELYPEGHPSARHSAVDWSHPDLDTYPHFQHAQVNEVVLQAGDLLYLPTNWFHHIVSLELNFQCNTRSGRSKIYDKDIKDCDFRDF